ncbi:MAG: four helix bundle protein [Candidatus Nomurabacteria bacterium]|nr:four helix bundle protein [Candidatus Nomurabacteria bacterium]
MTKKTPPIWKILPVLEIMKSAYILWQSCMPTIPKTSRYTLAETIDKYFIQTIESILVASFLERQEKQPFVRKAIISLDTLKFLLYILWEIKALDTKKYALLSEPLAGAGKQLGGWYGQLTKIKLSRQKVGREMKRVATKSRIVRVPIVVEMVPIEHHLVVILDEIRHVVVLNELYKMPSMPPPLKILFK